MPLEFSVNVDSGSIETALVSVFDPTRPIEISEFVINDSLELTFSFVDATGTPQFWSGDLAYDVRVALGEPGAVPPNGTFVLLDDGGASTPEFPTNTNAQTLEDALNALNGDTGPDGAQVDVTRSYNGLYIVKRRVAGVYPLLMGDGVLLSPEGTVVVDEITPGDVSTKQVMAVRLVQQPFSINQTWTQHIDAQTSEPIGYTGALNLANLRMLQFLAGSAERSTHLEVEVTSPTGNRVTHAQQKVKIRSEVIHAAAIDPAHFPEESAKYVHNRHQVTALTGGGFTALDGVPTRNTPVGLLAAVEAIAGKVQHYRLEAGTDAESLPDVVRPLDYETGTNEKVWKRKDAVVPSQTAFIDLGTLTGAGNNLVSMPEEARILTVRARINGTAPFFRYIELDKDSGQIGDVVFVQIEGNVSGTGTADVRMRHNGPYPTHYAMRLRAVASTVHGWFAFIKREESSQPWYYIGGSESAEFYSDPIFPISPSIPQKWYARLSSHLYELTDAPTVYTDLKESNAFKLTLTGNRTLNNPADTQDGHMVTWFIAQDNVGGRTLAYGSNYVNPPAIDTAPNAITMFTGVCMGGKVYCLQTSASALGLLDGAYRETSYGGNGEPDADKLPLFDNFGRLMGRGIIAQSPTNDTYFQLRDSNGDVVGSFSVQAGKLLLSDSLNACAILEINQSTFQALFDRDYAYDWVFGGNSIHFDLSPTFASPSAVRANIGLGTAATHNVPASGDASDTEVVLGSDSRLSPARALRKVETSTHTLELIDSYKRIRFTDTGAISVTIPLSISDDLPIETEIELVSENGGTLSFALETDGAVIFDSHALDAGGSGYTDTTNVATTGGSGTGLTVDITTTSGVVTDISVNASGSGYAVGDVITITGGDGLAAFTLTEDDVAVLNDIQGVGSFTLAFLNKVAPNRWNLTGS